METWNRFNQSKEYQTGCPAQANAMPPPVADTMTTTKSDINLWKPRIKELGKYKSFRSKIIFNINYVNSVNYLKSNWSTGYFDLKLDMMKTLS